MNELEGGRERYVILIFPFTGQMKTDMMLAVAVAVAMEVVVVVVVVAGTDERKYFLFLSIFITKKN